MQTEKALTILIVDDNAGDIYILRELLALSRLSVAAIDAAGTLAEALALVRERSYDVILLDYRLPDSAGLDSYARLQTFLPHIPVLILTGNPDEAAGLKSIHDGAQDYLLKGEYNAQLLEKSIRYSIERRDYLKTVRDSEAKYRVLFNENPFPALIFAYDTFRILEVNRAAIACYGYSRKEFSQLDIFALRQTLINDPLVRSIWDSQGRVVTEKFVTHRKKNGQEMIVESAYFPIDYQGRQAIQAQVYDVTERVQLERELTAERHRKRQDLRAAVLVAQEQERQKIGEELHDNVNQILSSARLYLDMGLADPTQSVSSVRRALELVGMAIEENRQLARQLILPQLKGEGLIASLLALREEFMLSSGMNLRMGMQGVSEADFTEAEKVSLYRIVQEQLTNITKYARARSVLLRLERRGDDLVLAIIDNGAGFDVASKGRGVGLMNMRNRAETMNGTFSIISAQGQGCTIRVTIPRPAVPAGSSPTLSSA